MFGVRGWGWDDSNKVVVGHGVGVVTVGRSVIFLGWREGVQLFPNETHSILFPRNHLGKPRRALILKSYTIKYYTKLGYTKILFRSVPCDY